MLSARQKDILNRIILIFEDTNEPVGSKAICDEMGLSSATIRNEMSELARLGYLDQPHTSAGRIPSELAYRLYVRELVDPIELSQREKNYINQTVFSAGNPEILLMRACDAISDITEQMCIASTPSDAESVISRIDLIPIKNRNFLLVMLTDSGIVKSCPVRVDENISSGEAAVFADVCARVFSDRMIKSIDKGIIQGLFATGDIPLKFANVSETLLSIIEGSGRSKVLASGEINLFSRGDIPIENSKKILSLLRANQVIPELLQHSKDQTDIIVGSELGHEALAASSAVLADYSFLDRKGGRIGIIGSTKMRYSRIIPIVRFAAKTVGDALSNLFETDGRNIYVQIR